MIFRLGGYFAGAPSQTASPQRNIHVIGTVAGGSVAFTVALGMFFTCFYKCGRPSRKQHPIIESMFFKFSTVLYVYDNHFLKIYSSEA